MRRLATVAAAAALVACSAAGPNTASVVSRAVPEGYGRLYVLREKQTVYSALPVTISVDGRTVGALRSGSYLATDVQSGALTLTVAVLLSRAITGFELAPGQTLYVDIALEPSGLPRPRGATGGASRAPITTQPALFSIRLLDEGAASAALAGLSPSD